jgi:hypothetical protein
MTNMKVKIVDAGAETPMPVVTRAFLTTAEVQREIIPLSRRAIFDLRKKGVIPSIESSGGKILFHRESVIAAMLRRQTGGVA